MTGIKKNGSTKTLLDYSIHRELLEKLEYAAGEAKSSYCLKSKYGDEVGPGIYAQAKTIRDEKNRASLILTFQSKRTILQWHRQDFVLTPHNELSHLQVEQSFQQQFNSIEENVQKKVLEAMRPEINKQSSITGSIYIGHGLGGVYAILAAVKLTINEKPFQIEVYTFGTPRIGDRKFAQYLESLDNNIQRLKIYRVTLDNDFIPRLPMWLKIQKLFAHSAPEIWIDWSCECFDQNPGGWADESPIPIGWNDRFLDSAAESGKIKKSEQIFYCQGPHRDGYLTESQDCNNQYKTTHNHINDGPYFGHFMGFCQE